MFLKYFFGSCFLFSEIFFGKILACFYFIGKTQNKVFLSTLAPEL